MIAKIEVNRKTIKAIITSNNRQTVVNVASKNKISAVFVGRQGPKGTSVLENDAPNFALMYQIGKL
jgi:hypothetical protein